MTEFIPLLSIYDPQNETWHKKTFYLNINSGKISLNEGKYRHQNGFGYAITINNNRIVIPNPCNHNLTRDDPIFISLRMDISFSSLDNMREKYGLGAYKLKNIILQNKTDHNVKIPIDAEIVFNDNSDHAAFILYFSDRLFDNSKNYDIVD